MATVREPCDIQRSRAIETERVTVAEPTKIDPSQFTKIHNGQGLLPHVLRGLAGHPVPTLVRYSANLFLPRSGMCIFRESSSTDAPLPERQSSRNLLSRQASKLSKADVDADDGPPDDDDLFEESVWMESSSGSWVQPTHEHASTLQRARDSNQSKRA